MPQFEMIHCVVGEVKIQFPTVSENFFTVKIHVKGPRLGYHTEVRNSIELDKKDIRNFADALLRLLPE